MFDEKESNHLWFRILIFSNILFILIIGYLYLFNPFCSEDELIITETDIMVQIAGEIKNPNVYEVKSGSRLKDLITLAGGFTDEADIDSVNLTIILKDEMKISIPKRVEDGEVIDPSTHKININTADQETLETLNMIGPSKAQAIIQYRNDNGYFKTIEEIMNVSGIGEKTFDSIKNDICV